MNLLDYKAFKEDAEKYLKDSIARFKLKLNEEMNIIENVSIDYYLFYENGSCIISLNIIESFPYQDVIPKFYLKNEDRYLEINQDYLRTFLGINEKEFEAYCIENYNNRFSYSDSFKNSDKGGIYYGLYSINEILLKYYFPLFNGKYSIQDYESFVKSQLKP